LFGTIRCRPYAHVFALYYGDYFFAIISDERLYLRTNDLTRQWYLHRNMPAFPIPMGDTHLFYEVPEKIIDRQHLVMRLAREAIAVCREQIPEPPMAQSIG
jgi:TfoX/Sxy family transcriptional regulator of competence genes